MPARAACHAIPRAHVHDRGVPGPDAAVLDQRLIAKVAQAHTAKETLREIERDAGGDHSPDRVGNLIIDHAGEFSMRESDVQVEHEPFKRAVEVGPLNAVAA